MVFNSINSEILIFAAIFLIFTAIFRFALTKRFMRQDKGTASIIAICLSLLVTYGLTKTRISTKFLDAINLGPEFLVNVLPWLIIILLAAIALKWGVGILVLSLGIISTVAAFGGFVYAKTFLAIVGIILTIAGIFLIRWRNKQRNYQGMNLKDREDYKLKRRANRRK